MRPYRHSGWRGPRRSGSRRPYRAHAGHPPHSERRTTPPSDTGLPLDREPHPLLLQILVNNFDEFFSGQRLRCLAPRVWVHQMFANMVFDYLGDESVQGAAAGGCLLEDIGALIIRLDGSFDRLDLTAQSSDAIQQFGFFRRDVTHGSNSIELPYPGRVY